MTVDVGEGLADGEGEGDGEAEGEGDAVADGEAPGEAEADGDTEGDGEGDAVGVAAESAAIIGTRDLSSNVSAWSGVRLVRAAPTRVAATATSKAGPSVRNNFTR